MFSKNSRYRNLPESSPVDAQGQRRRGKDLRLIPPTPARFIHTVRAGDQLDLLAFKFYSDATKWWQICDANPTLPFPADPKLTAPQDLKLSFPTDLLDEEPLVEARFVLSHPGFRTRLANLLNALSGFGTRVDVGKLIFVTNLADLLSALGRLVPVEPSEPDFFESTVAVVYNPATAARQQILTAIQGQSFRFLRSFAWPVDSQRGEAFTFMDPAVSLNWHRLAVTLAGTPGIVQLQSVVAEATLHVVYNNAMVARETVSALIQAEGFEIVLRESAARVGKQIVVPPNQFV